MLKNNNKYWMLIVLAACFEVVWVIGLKHANSSMEWLVTIIAIAVSFGVLIFTSKKLPTSTVYAVFVGLGTAGSVIAEMTMFDVPFRWSKIGFITLLLIGVIGLKLVTHEKGNDAESTPDRGASRSGGKIT
ncbi:DMT family transporter [Paenibacillus sp. strain BS8-2]